VTASRGPASSWRRRKSSYRAAVLSDHENAGRSPTAGLPRERGFELYDFACLSSDRGTSAAHGRCLFVGGTAPSSRPVLGMTRETKPGASWHAAHQAHGDPHASRPVLRPGSATSRRAARHRPDLLYATQPTGSSRGRASDSRFNGTCPHRRVPLSQSFDPRGPEDSVTATALGPSTFRRSLGHPGEPAPHRPSSRVALRHARAGALGMRRQGSPHSIAATPTSGPLPRLARWPLDAPDRLLLGRFDGYLCVGHHARAYLRRFGARDSLMWDAPHCIDTEFFGRAADTHRTPEARQAAARPSASRALPSCAVRGKLEPKKRPLDLVRATRR